jgi:glucose/arabinose dehydrogenase
MKVFRRAYFLLIGLFACGGTPGTDPPPPDAELRAIQVAEGLRSPVYLTSPPDDERLFIVEQVGRIRILKNGDLLPTPFLDITDRVVSGGERGLLSVAFHPDYGSNGAFFVNYTGAGGATRVERYQASSDPDRADVESAQLVLTAAQRYSNHNGGLVKFGPDGMLYVGMGDGGSGGDPQGHGQNRSTLLGALLRLDVDAAVPYGIPADNPYLGAVGARPEIWATGLRNPWRFSFDFEEDMIYIADVGQNRLEEINARPAADGGLNYGWNLMEGSACYPSGSNCDARDLVLPVLDYGNSAQGCSVTGGYVYRGSALPQLRGHYFYGDYCRGAVRSFRLTADGEAVDRREWPLGQLGSISSFGEDSARELYVVVHQGRIYRLEP